MDEIKFVGGLILSGLFAVAIIFFAINFGNENNTAFNIQDQPGFNETYNNLRTNITQYNTETINATDSFYRSEIQEGETVRTGGQFKLGPSTALRTTDNILQQSFKSIFGSDSAFSIFLTTLITFLAFVVGLLIWKTWKGGLPG